MKAIELTEEHKSKLLVMCKKIYPEYDKYTFWGHEDFVGMYNIDKNGEEIVEGNTSIHWFEFCVIHLAEKLLSHNRKPMELSKWQKFRLTNQNSSHPVDYLYEQFKLLK